MVSSSADFVSKPIHSGEEDHFDGFDTAIFVLLTIFLFSSAFSIAMTQIGYFSALILWIGRMAVRRKFAFPRTPLDLFFLAYACAEIVATVFAYNKGQSLLYLQRRLLILPIVYILLGNIRSIRHLKIFLGALLASALFVSLWSMRDLVLHLGEYLTVQRRLDEFQMYMTAGGIMMIAMLLLLPFTVHPRTPLKARVIGLLMLIPLSINLLFTFTRSSWLGFLAGVIVIGTLRARRIFPIVFVVLMFLVIALSPEMKERMLSTFDPAHPNNVPRVHMWETGWKMFLDHPIVGIGDIGTEQLWDRYVEPGWKPEGHLHNNVIMWMTTLGLLGLSALCALFVKIWIVMVRTERAVHTDWFLGSLALGGLAVIAGFHVNGLFEWNFGDTEIIMLIWATVGLTMACGKFVPVQVSAA